jgi:hypothetical protein
MSDALRISSDGCAVGRLIVPPFRLHAGAAVCVHLPGPVYSQDWKALVNVLTGAQPLSGVRQFGRVKWAEPASTPTTILGLLRIGRLAPMRPVDWLQRVAGLSAADSASVVARLNLRPEWRLSQLAANPRTLLGLEAVWAQRADAVVFHTVGCDPSGVKRVFEAVAAHLAECPAIYLSSCFWQDDGQQRDHFPDATCLEITQSTNVPDSLAPVEGGS